MKHIEECLILGVETKESKKEVGKYFHKLSFMSPDEEIFKVSCNDVQAEELKKLKLKTAKLALEIGTYKEDIFVRFLGIVQ